MAEALKQPDGAYDKDGFAIGKAPVLPSEPVKPVEEVSKVEEVKAVDEPVIETTTKEEKSTEVKPENQSEEPKKDEIDLADGKTNHSVKRMFKWMERAAKAEAELNSIKNQNQQAPPVEIPPKREQFKNDSDYLAAAVQYEVKKQVPILQQQVQAQPNGSIDDVKKLYGDYDEVMEDAETVTVPDHAVPVLTQSPLFEHLRYYLTKHPEQAKALWSMTPQRAAAQLGKIEAKIEQSIESKPTQKQVSQARAPITPVKIQGASAGKVDESKMSDSDWFALERKRTMERNKQRIVYK